MTPVFLPAILIIGAFFRFYNNTAIALWHDEAFSALYLRYPWGEMMYRIGLDVHPPLYYLVLRVWSYFAGASLWSLRLVSIFFAVLTIWSAYIFVKAAFHNKKLALLAALFIAINPFQIQYALEARMYTLGTFFALWSSYFLVRALDQQNENKNFSRYWLGYALTLAAGFYTHYYLLFTITAQGLYLLIYAFKSRSIKIFLSGIGAYVIAAILYLPWIKTFLAQLSRVEASYWIPPMNRWSVPGTVWKMIFGGQGASHIPLIITSAVSLIVIYYFAKKVRNPAKWLIIFGVVIPIIAAVALSLRTNIYLDRYFVFASLFFSILIAVAFNAIPNRFARRVIMIALAAVSIFAFFKNWTDLAVKDKPGMAAAANLVNQNAKPGDSIYVGSSFIFFTFKYYNATPIKPLLYSTAKLEEIPHFSGTAILTNNDLITDFRKTEKGQTVWLLWTTGFGGSKPDVPKPWRQIEEQSYRDAPGFKGLIFVTKYQVN